MSGSAGRRPGGRLTLLAWLLAALLPLLTAFPVAAGVPSLLLAREYERRADVADYLVSEKLDGVRAYWDGQQLWTRQGNPINAPASFTANWPKHPLDGELWLGRGRFEAVSGLVRAQIPTEADWRAVRYMVFELPDAPGPFVERAAQIERLVRTANAPSLAAVKQSRVTSHAALMKRLDAVVASGGEGLMLHRAAAPYATGRSDDLLKVKYWRDAEATVIGHQPGKGRFSGLLGALRVRTADGREFALGSGFSTAQRKSPPAVGAVVTYRYRELTRSGQPRHATFWRVREP